MKFVIRYEAVEKKSRWHRHLPQRYVGWKAIDISRLFEQILALFGNKGQHISFPAYAQVVFDRFLGFSISWTLRIVSDSGSLLRLFPADFSILSCHLPVLGLNPLVTWILHVTSLPKSSWKSWHCQYYQNTYNPILRLLLGYLTLTIGPITMNIHLRSS